MLSRGASCGGRCWATWFFIGLLVGLAAAARPSADPTPGKREDLEKGRISVKTARAREAADEGAWWM